jgi:hypothetical protein
MKYFLVCDVQGENVLTRNGHVGMLADFIGNDRTWEDFQSFLYADQKGGVGTLRSMRGCLRLLFAFDIECLTSWIVPAAQDQLIFKPEDLEPRHRRLIEELAWAALPAHLQFRYYPRSELPPDIGQEVLPPGFYVTLVFPGGSS